MAGTMTSKEILERLRYNGIKGKEIAAFLGIPESAVSNLYRGHRRLKHDEATKLMGLLGTKEKEMPVIGMAGAGDWVQAVELTKETVSVPSSLFTEYGGVFAVQVAGDSMDILLPEGSYAIIDPQQIDLFDRRLFLLINSEGEATIKLYRSDPARFEPVSMNPIHVPFAVGQTDFKVIGRVTGSIRTF